MTHDPHARRHIGAKGYPWVSFPRSTAAWISLCLTFLIILASGTLLHWYLGHTQDASPDSPLGFLFALLGTASFLAAAFFYWHRRRSQKRFVGQLNAALHWHTFFGVSALVLLTLHSFGNFNARSGTYALFGMIAVAMTGIVGRFLDRILARMSAREADVILTAQGDDQLDAITSQVQRISVSQPLAPSASPTAQRMWVIDPRGDLVRALSAQGPIGKSSVTTAGQVGGWPDESRAHLKALRSITGAMHREQTYRYVLRYWRLQHKLLVLATIGLTIWHIVYAVGLLWPH